MPDRLLGLLLLLTSLAPPVLSQSLQGPPAEIGKGSLRSRALPGGHGRCGTPQPDAATVAAVEKVLALGKRTAPKPTGIRIPVTVHLITAGREGAFSKNVVNVLIHNLNAAFAGTPFSFTLSKLNKTNNAAWYANCGDFGVEDAMKRRLAFKPAKVLNIYSCIPAGPGLPAGVIGYSDYPWSYPENSYLQGVVIHPGTLPTDAGLAGYDHFGLNAVHEIGHWLGLYHTFEGRCEDRDLVADTPAQASPSFTCDLTRDSCLDGPGLDDVRNYMNYADDFCFDHFTAGQAERMMEVVRTFRPSLR
jgi:hypothetical protein